MRFYQQRRGLRIFQTALWIVLMLMWISLWPLRPATTHLTPFIWLFLGVIQIATAWTYWDITPEELVVHAFGLRRRYALGRIDRIGPAHVGKRALPKSIQIDYRDRSSIYVTVADRSAFQAALQAAMVNRAREPFTTGPLGL